MIFADLHFHSKYSRAVSKYMDLEHIVEGSKKKGLGLLGSADFTHPKWFSELKGKLCDTEGEGAGGKGVYEYNGMKFILQTEVATFFSEGGKSRKVHHIILAPDFEVASQLSDVFSRMGNLSADGRPMFAKTSCASLVEKCMQISRDIEVIPAHAFTPWFGVFGSNSGYDSLEEAYGDHAKNVHAIETGLSSDPEMNWRLSQLDRITQISNSDSHSFATHRIGRECNAFDFGKKETTFGYGNLLDIIRKKNNSGFKYTIEVDPAYGKYHFDGHRLCGVSLAPVETRKLKGICPKCGQKLTIGVEYRVEELADRPKGFTPKGAVPFKRLLPLQELIATALGVAVTTKKPVLETEKLIRKFGNELRVLLEVEKSELARETPGAIADIILLNREGKLKVMPGYDGVYGEIVLEGAPAKPAERSSGKENGQTGLSDFCVKAGNKKTKNKNGLN